MMKRVVVLAAVLAVLGGVAAYGSSSRSSNSTSRSSSAVASAASALSCGTIPTAMPADPDGVLAKLPAGVKAAYKLFPQAVHTSAWANWKPKHKPPYTLYFSPGNTSTPFIQDILSEFNLLKAKTHVIGKIITQDSNNDLTTQIQQIQQAIRNKVDIMVVLPLAPAAEDSVLTAAGKAGIPVLAPLNPAANRYVVGVDGNIPLLGAALGQQFVRALGDKGNVLDVHGIPGVFADSGIYDGINDVLKHCPNIKTVGSIVGQFVPSVAKAATLEFLAAHPQPVNGAIETGGMSTGIIQAFQQTGRSVPTIADDGATPGALAYWKAHASTYKGSAVAIAPADLTAGTWDLALGLLAGRGVKITDVLANPLVVHSSNLSQWVQPGWSLTTPIAYAQAPPSVSFFSSSYVNQFFTK